MTLIKLYKMHYLDGPILLAIDKYSHRNVENITSAEYPHKVNVPYAGYNERHHGN